MTTQAGKTTDDERGLLNHSRNQRRATGNEYCLPALRRLYRTPFYEKAP